MIVCLCCRHTWPDSAAFCGHCKRSFGGRRCPHGHLSPRFAKFCTTCGDKNLSLAASSLSTTGFARVIAWVLVFLFLKVVVPYLPDLFGFVLACFDWLFGFIFGTRLSSLLVAAFHFCLNLAVITALLALFFPGFRKRLPSIGRGAAKLLRLAWKLGLASLRLSFHVLRYLAQGGTHEQQSHRGSQGSRPIGH